MSTETHPLCTCSKIRIECYPAIDELPECVWNSLALRASVGLETAHLRAVEESRINNLHPYYIIGYSENKPVGIAYCFAMDMDLATLAMSEPAFVLEAVRCWQPGFLKQRIIEVGHLASLGTTIEIAHEYRDDFLKALCAQLEIISTAEKAQLGIVRDIPTHRYADFCAFENAGFVPLPGFPIARLAIDWTSFDGYLGALKSKKRNSVLHRRAVFCKNARLHNITTEIIEDYGQHAARLAELWQQVAARHGEYEHERLTAQYFASMAKNLAGRSHVIAIKKDGTIIAFGLALIGNDDYFGVAEGMDYAACEEGEVYSNIVFESIRIACTLSKKSANLGITTYDFKTSLGAELESCIYLVKSFAYPKQSAAYADLLGRGIHQSENHHRAFKNCTTTRIQPQDAASPLLQSRDPEDPFSRHCNFTRADIARATGIYSYFPAFESAQGPVVNYCGRDVIMLGTNSYLGLAHHPDVVAAAHAAIDKYGTGCSGSPLLNGTLDMHESLTSELAAFMHKEAALVFSTGYQTNLGVISALVNRDQVIIMDERNHASIVDGALLSRATLVRYKHANTQSLAEALERYSNKPKLVITDSLFSMEGSIADLPEIIRLTKKYHARLMLDESHALGVIGPTGRGVAEAYGALADVDLVMGTFSKSFASIGGFVAGSSAIIDMLKHCARSYIFSASLPPASVAAVRAALIIVDAEPQRRARLHANTKFLAHGLRALGYNATSGGGAIVPLFCGNELLAMAAFHKLLAEGVFVNPVISPAVPSGQEMLRLSLMATHEEATLKEALAIFARIRTPYWPAWQTC